MKTKDKLSAASARSVICVLRSVDARCALTGEKPSVTLLPSQMSLRAMSLARNTAQRELSAVRFLLREMVSEDLGQHIGLVFDEHPWLRKTRMSEARSSLEFSERHLSDIREDASRVIRLIRDAGNGIDLGDLDDEELARRVSGVRNERPDKVVNKGNDSLLHRDYLRLVMDLSEHDAEADVENYVRTGAVRPGVAKAVIGALYLFGLRPVELWKSLVYVPRTDISLPPGFGNSLRKSPLVAIGSGMMVESLTEARRLGTSQGEAISRAERLTGAPSVLAVGTAKTTNANKDLMMPVRVMTLAGIDRRDASVIAAACMLRFSESKNPAGASPKNPRQREIDRIRTTSISVLRGIASKWPDMRQDLTLYTFRHSFVTRARSSLPDAESAALTGHTSRVTFGGYGEKRKKRASGWMPAADPERAKMIKEVWDRKLSSPETEKALMNSQEYDSPKSEEEISATPEGKNA